MCGRYTLTVDLIDLMTRFNALLSNIEWTPRYNLAPSQKGLVVIRADKQNILKEMKWGLIPHWAKDPGIGNRLINARLENLDEKASFRESLQKRRCIIPADGFYEWQKSITGKVPLRITLETGDAFGFAGLWDSWTSPSGENIDTYTIITTEPVDVSRDIHSRMPLILPPELEETWLSGPAIQGTEGMKQFLAMMHPAVQLRAYRVSSLVNKTANDSKECIVEVNAEQ